MGTGNVHVRVKSSAAQDQALWNRYKCKQFPRIDQPKLQCLPAYVPYVCHDASFGNFFIPFHITKENMRLHLTDATVSRSSSGARLD